MNGNRRRRKSLALAVALAGLSLAGTVRGNRLQPSDLIYRGAFRLPAEFNWGARGVTFYPPGDGGRGSLLILAHDHSRTAFGEVDIPVPDAGGDWSALPAARLLKGPAEFDGTLIEDQLPYEYTFGGGIEYVPRRGSQSSAKLYGSADVWYWVSDDTFPAVWFSELDGSDPRGLFHVGPESFPFHGNRVGDYLFTFPDWYADRYLGGRSLATGKSRGAFGGSMGPAIFAFRPWGREDPSGHLDAVDLLWYPLDYDCASPNQTDKDRCLYPDFTMCDKWLGGAFVEGGGRRAVLLFGVKGLGENRYGDPQPGDCDPYRGYHCDPFERQVIFYDADELGAAALGEREPYSVIPYLIWRPAEFFLGDGSGRTCGQTGGMAFDRAGGRLFLIEKGLAGGDNAAAVHVWETGPGPVPAGTGDYDGDGTADIAVFRPDSGLWAVRDVTRAYFGGSSDLPVPEDYRGEGTTEPAIFRGSSGLWAMRGVTRVYFGTNSDRPVPADYTGDGPAQAAIFRHASGLWAVRSVTRIYFGAAGDLPVPGDYDGSGTRRPAVFRPASGLWAVRSATRVYFGAAGDLPVPGDYDGSGTRRPAVFRPASGLWAVRGLTRAHFGNAADLPVPGDFRGDGTDRISVFRDATGLWAIRRLTRLYFGRSGDIPATR